jgi:hypothetical protein
VTMLTRDQLLAEVKYYRTVGVCIGVVLTAVPGFALLGNAAAVSLCGALLGTLAMMAASSYGLIVEAIDVGVADGDEDDDG